MNQQKDWIEEHNRLMKLLDQATQELKKYPGVTSVEIGIKETGGDLTDNLSFRVYVTKKKAPDELSPGEKIPGEILGVKTDVIEYDIPVPTSDDNKYRPVKGGIQLANEEDYAGTLGCIARLTSDNSIVVLSNAHVLMGNEVSVPNVEVGQPEISGSCCCECDKIGKVLKVKEDGIVDCGIASLKSGVTGSNTVRMLDDDGSDGTLQGDAPAVVSPDTVKKVGRTSDKTLGTVVSITHATAANTSEGTPARTNQILVRPNAGTNKFQDQGDSGAVLVDNNNRVIGLMWGAYLKPGHALFGNGIACPIANVLTEMGITIISGNLTSFTYSNPRKRAVIDDQLIDGEQLIERLQSRIRRTEQGNVWLNLVERHRPEVLKLINHNRKVTVTWHRMQGPAFLAALGRSLKLESYRLPDEIEGVTRQQALATLLEVLAEEGSETLHFLIQQHSTILVHTFTDCKSVEEIICALEKEFAEFELLTEAV